MILSQAGRREMRRLAKLQSAGSYLEVGERLRELSKEPPPSRLVQQRENILRDEEYLAWIRKQKCYVENGHCSGRIEAHHTRTYARGVKGSDYETLPFCDGLHHPQWHSLGIRAFCTRHNLHLPTEFKRLRAKYEKETGRKA
jgi:hypothetical protein